MKKFFKHRKYSDIQVIGQESQNHYSAQKKQY
jgi:beta-galactosidase beta subunit